MNRVYEWLKDEWRDPLVDPVTRFFDRATLVSCGVLGFYLGVCAAMVVASLLGWVS